jgi:hypothetical protein
MHRGVGENDEEEHYPEKGDYERDQASARFRRALPGLHKNVALVLRLGLPRRRGGLLVRREIYRVGRYRRARGCGFSKITVRHMGRWLYGGARAFGPCGFPLVFNYFYGDAGPFLLRALMSLRHVLSARMLRLLVLWLLLLLRHGG